MTFSASAARFGDKIKLLNFYFILFFISRFRLVCWAAQFGQICFKVYSSMSNNICLIISIIITTATSTKENMKENNK